MLDLIGAPFRCCDGVTRRSFLKAGYLGLAGLSLSDVLRVRAQAEAAGKAPADDLSIVLVWLDGGPPHHETYDPKPDAPVEFRGPLGAISTSVPGVQVSELLPYHARMMHKMSIIRSLYHNNGDHFAAAHWMLTGFLGSNAADLGPQYPSAASVITKIKGAKKPGIPGYVGLPHTHSVGLAPGYHGAAYLGVAYNPFSAEGDPNNDGYQVPNLNLPGGVDPTRLDNRRGLLHAFDNARRDVDASGLMDGLDRFGQEAFAMVTGPAAREAFNLKKENPRLRDRYGRHTWGQSALLARRLVEAGVRFVTLTYGGWDHHANIGPAMHNQLPIIDAAIGSLVDDLDQRGLLEKTIVMVMGEFGRTPRMNPTAGRDHWGEVMSVLIAGGGLAEGTIIGASNARGELPKDRPVTPQDLIVTLYRRLGIDPQIAFTNRAGRPIPIGSNGQVISELC
ncbi:MAG TPA: DUF1501 domain-containing protein [Isosphaeraceae bacterium]|jgi:hypothetical protein|nr:DUF1501 domain-containing protein [Isosphaeraceae bacterium]